MNNTLSRNQIRQQVRQARRALSSQQQTRDAELLLQQLISHEKLQHADHVAISLAFDGEIDTTPIIEWCWKNNKRVYLPVIHPFSKGHLLFLHYHQQSSMTTNQYGILEPELDQRNICPVAQLDLIFTPLVAFDDDGNRIGMGGGYYDRTLAPWFEQQRGPYPIGLAHNCQRVAQLPIESWDVPLPEIVTPEKRHLFTTSNEHV